MYHIQIFKGLYAKSDCDDWLKEIQTQCESENTPFHIEDVKVTIGEEILATKTNIITIVYTIAEQAQK